MPFSHEMPNILDICVMSDTYLPAVYDIYDVSGIHNIPDRR